MTKRPYRSADLPRVQELLDQGETHAAIEGEVGVSTRTISRWLKEGRLRHPSLLLEDAAPTAAPDRAPEQEWTARALLDLGMDPAVVARILPLGEYKPATSTRRYREWLSRYVTLVAASIPEEWAAAVAFLPIVGRDLCNQAMEELATLMQDSAPWEDKELRNRYGRMARLLLRDARVRFEDWLLFIRDTEMTTALPVVEAGVVSEVLKRCPHVDKPIRKRRPVHKEDKMLGLHLLREMSMGALAMSWSRLVDGDPPWLEAYAERATAIAAVREEPA